MQKAICIAVLGMALFISPSLRADTFNFGLCGQITTSGAVCPGNSTKTLLTYANGILSVNASAYTLPGGAATNLYVKQGGTGEIGLGTTLDTVDHEITVNDFVNLNLSNLVTNGILNGTLTIESTQTGEGYKVCEGSTLGSLGGSCVTGGAGTGTTTIPLAWTSSTDIIGITAWNANGNTPAANILIEGLTVPTAAPEPGTIVMLGMGIVGLLGIRRKRVPA